MAVMMQAFFWDCPKIDEQEHNWWNHVASKVEDLQRPASTPSGFLL